ncbi:MAG TPA: TonB-dependent receptor [Pyrinomonadaceae bacterium]|nr:TonB-dependent receptor [Pyrinomonadaceae bacterium]
MYKKTRQILITFTIFCLSAAAAWAQATGGRVTGTITDAAGSVVANATITLKSRATGQALTTQSGETGSYNFPNAAVGDYDLTVEAAGFQPAARELKVVLNQETVLNFAVAVGAIKEEVTVTATAEPAVQTENSGQSGSFSSRQVTELPIFNDLTALARLLPNTSEQAAGVLGEGGTIGGLRPQANVFNLDGVGNNDPTTTGAAVKVIQDAVEQFTLLQNNYAAEFGTGAAGQFNTITKSGSNEFHGSGFLYLQSQKFNAATSLEEQQLQTGALNHLPLNKTARYGLTAGGPLVKNKLFFFGAYQHYFNDRSQDYKYFAPTTEGLNRIALLPNVSPYVVRLLRENLVLAPQASADATAAFGSVLGATGIPFGTVILSSPAYRSEHLAQINIDHSPNAFNQFRYRFNSDRRRAEDPTLGRGYGNPKFNALYAYDADLFSATWVRTIDTSMVNDLRLSYRRVKEDYPLKEASASDFPFLGVDSIGLSFGPDINFPQGSPVNHSYQLSEALSYFRGNHSFKLGAEARHLIYSVNFVQAARGYYYYNDLDELLQDKVPSLLNQRGVATNPFAGNHYEYAVFAQDDWKVRPSLTFNLGLRYEYATLPRDLATQALNSLASVPGVIEFGVPQTDKNNFAPRVGLAYAPEFESGVGRFLFGSRGESALRAAFSISYLPQFQNLTLTSLPPQFSQKRDIATSAAAFGFNPSRPFLENGGIPGQLIPVTTPAQARAATSAYIPDQISPYAMSWSVSYQRALPQAMTVELRYLGTRGRKLPVQLRLNAGMVGESNLVIPTFFQTPTPQQLAALPTLGQIKSRPGMNTRRLAAYGFSQDLTSYQFAGDSQYDGASVSLTRNYTRGLGFTAAYTWSKTIDDATNVLNSSVPNPRRPQDFYNIKGDRGLSALDIPHRFVASFIYELPFFAGREARSLHTLFGGWQLSTIFQAQSGQPITPLSGKDANLNFDSAADRTIINVNGVEGTSSGVRPINAAGQTVSFGNSATVAYVVKNPNAQYIQAGQGALANAGRNTLRTRGFNRTDASLLKSFRFSEDRFNLQVGVEALNLFNQRMRTLATLPDQNADFATLFATAGSSNFNDYGLGNATGRTFQLRAKMIF